MSTTKTKVLICPYCGDTQPAGERCRVCGGLFEPLSRQASHNAMGPWFVRDERRPFQPGASYETIIKLVERGQITKYTIIRGPTTKQFWTVARRVPGIAHALGYCHNCDATVSKDDHGCPVCGVPFGAYLERNYLGLPEVKPLPWEAPVMDEGRPRPVQVPGPAVDFRRAAEPLGLSSFASDDELRGLAARPPYVPTTPSGESVPATAGLAARASGSERINGETAAVAFTTQPMHSTMGAALPTESRSAILDSSAAGVAARSMQRRLHRQQQTIRWLMITVGAVTVLSIILIISMLARLAQSPPAPPAGNGGGQQPAVNQPVPAGGERHSAGSPASRGAAPATQPLDTHAAASTLPADELTGPAAEAIASFKADHERAAGLVLEAKNEQRALKDRVRDGEQAVALLKNIKTKAPPSQQPAGLDQEITEAERLVERLKLQEFFP